MNSTGAAAARGFGGLWAFGLVILVHLTVYNETGGTSTALAAIVATLSAALIERCQRALAHVQLPYMRATHRFDFFCQFLALWMDILALLACCAALARTLSTCMDAMSGGMARIYLLGRNSPDNEPWPDVLGVSVVFLLTVMFMLGLENTRVFAVLMQAGVLGLSAVLGLLCATRGRWDGWRPKAGTGKPEADGRLLPRGIFGLLTSAALCTITFSSTMYATASTASPMPPTTTSVVYRRCCSALRLLGIGVSIAYTAVCLSAITPSQPDAQQPYLAVPILPLLERLDFHTLQPAVACALVLACSGAYLELFPAMYTLIVRLTQAEWRILPRQIGYESADSGAPVLAIFTGASLCAMLAFACPLQNLVYMLAGAHLVGALVRTAYLLYAPLRPKFVVASAHDASLAYSRLDVTQAKPPASALPSHHHHHHHSNPNHRHHHHHPTSASASATRSSSLWSFLRKPAQSMSMLPTSATKSMLKKKKKSKRDEELEREWLLLGEPPQSPRLGLGAAAEAAIGGGGVGVDCAESSIVGTASSPSESQQQLHQPPRHRLSDMECIDVLDDDQVDIRTLSGSDSDSAESSSSGSTTDIDAIVDEYRQKVKVSTAGPMEKTVRLPTLNTWRLSLVLMTCLAGVLLVAAIGALHNEHLIVVAAGAAVCALAAPFAFIPRYAHGPSTPAAVTCVLAMLVHTTLLVPALTGCWPAILFWAAAGAMLFVRCDRWCCACLDGPRRHGAVQQHLRARRRGHAAQSMLLLPNAAATGTSASMVASPSGAASGSGLGSGLGAMGGGHMAAIRIPCPPRGATVASRIAGHR